MIIRSKQRVSAKDPAERQKTTTTQTEVWHHKGSERKAMPTKVEADAALLTAFVKEVPPSLLDCALRVTV